MPRSRAHGGRTGRNGTNRPTAPPLPQQPIATSLATVELRSDIDGVMLLLDGVESSHLNLVDPTNLMFEYMQQFMVVLSQTHPGRTGLKVAHLGGAGCAVARAIDAQWPQPRQIAVEIDAELARLVREWFDLPRSPRLRIRVGDARAELSSMSGLDVIIRDAFVERDVPEHLCTCEFTHEVAQALAPGGVYLANLADRPPLRQARREIATVRTRFQHVLAIAEPAVLRGRRYGNVVIAASHDPLELPQLARALRSLPTPAAVIEPGDTAAFAGTAEPLHDPDPDNGPRQS